MKFYASGVRSQHVLVEFEAPANTPDDELERIAASMIYEDEDCWVKNQDVTEVSIDSYEEDDEEFED